MNRNTISRVIKQIKVDISVKRKKETGWKEDGDRNKPEKAVTILKRNPNLSGKNVARKLDSIEGIQRANVPDIKNKYVSKMRAKKLCTDFMLPMLQDEVSQKNVSFGMKSKIFITTDTYIKE